MRRLIISFLLLVIYLSFNVPALAADKGQLLSAETRLGDITVPGQKDYLTFWADAGQMAYVFYGRTCDDSHRECVCFYDPWGALMGCACQEFCGAGFIWTMPCRVTGFYTIEPSTSGGTGQYGVTFINSSGNVVCPQDIEGGDIFSGEPRAGHFDSTVDADGYYFFAEAGDTVEISLDTNALDPNVTLFGPSGLAGLKWVKFSPFVKTLTESGRYEIVVDTRLDPPNDYSLLFTSTTGSQMYPALRIKLNSLTFRTGDTVQVEGLVTNGPTALEVEEKTWILRPDGKEMKILQPHQSLIVPPNAYFFQPLITYSFNGTEPAGTYQVGGRFIDKISGTEYSVNVVSFTFTP